MKISLLPLFHKKTPKKTQLSSDSYPVVRFVQRSCWSMLLLSSYHQFHAGLFNQQSPQPLCQFRWATAFCTFGRLVELFVPLRPLQLDFENLRIPVLQFHNHSPLCFRFPTYQACSILSQLLSYNNKIWKSSRGVNTSTRYCKNRMLLYCSRVN